MARVGNVEREDLPESQRHIYDEITGARGVTSIGSAFGALMNSPEVTGYVTTLGAYLRFQAKIPDATRELVILTIARELNCDYEWGHHKPLAVKVGVSDATIEAIHEGKAPEGLSQDEAAIVRYVQMLLRKHSMSDDIFEPVLRQLNTVDLIDLTVMVGYYNLLAMAFAALGVELEEGFIGLNK